MGIEMNNICKDYFSTKGSGDLGKCGGDFVGGDVITNGTINNIRTAICNTFGQQKKTRCKNANISSGLDYFRWLVTTPPMSNSKCKKYKKVLFFHFRENISSCYDVVKKLFEMMKNDLGIVRFRSDLKKKITEWRTEKCKEVVCWSLNMKEQDKCNLKAMSRERDNI